ncbi:MAG: hypothetical protein ACR2NU_13915 [Aeoliella sp.]
MSKYFLTAAAAIALTFTVASADNAEARGFHFVGGGVHIDVGNPHGFHGGHGCHYPSFWNNHVWHRTGHWDYHPTEYRWHGNHWDVTPGHYDWHDTSHIDHLHP